MGWGSLGKRVLGSKMAGARVKIIPRTRTAVEIIRMTFGTRVGRKRGLAIK